MSAQLVIGVAGLPHAGKNTATKILTTIFGLRAQMLSSSLIIEDFLQSLGVLNFKDRSTKERCYTECAKRFDNEWLLPLMHTLWTKCSKPVWIFNGVSMPWDVEFIHSFDRWLLFYIDAPFEKRFERARCTVRTGVPTGKLHEIEMTEEAFHKLHEHVTIRHIENIKNIPSNNVVIVKNAGTVRDLGGYIVATFLNRSILTCDTLKELHDALEELYQELESPR